MKYLSLLLSVVFMASCAMPSPEPTPTPEVTRMPVKEHVVSSVLWQQHSAEYRALCYQAFNIAALRLQQLEGASEKPLAIITDIDETVLDNSPYSGMQVQEDLEFDKNDWIEWGKQQSAPEVPGAVEFFNFADSLGVEVFYISNRYHVQIDETLANMQALDLPNADTSHVFLKTETSEKQARRDRILNDYEVVLYLGDNLSDFSSVFDGQGTAARNQSAKDLQASFGDQFIVFPNPMYGDWESKGIYEAGRDWSSSEMDSIRKSKIRSFR